MTGGLSVIFYYYLFTAATYNWLLSNDFLLILYFTDLESGGHAGIYRSPLTDEYTIIVTHSTDHFAFIAAK